MNYYYRNNETDFYTWCCKYVHRALADVKYLANSPLAKDHYQEALKIKSQYEILLCSLNQAQREYFERYIIGKERPPYKPSSTELFKSIFQNWSQICFPKGKSRFRKIDPILLGGTLKQQRLILCLSVTKAAGLIGIASKTLYAYEEGYRMTSLDALYSLCQLYGINVDALLKLASH